MERISAYEKIGWSTLKTDYVYDGRGSVAQTLTYNSSWYTFGGELSKKTVESFSYTPFGELLTGEGSGYRFNGEYYDSATGMLNLRARQYEPGMMRFSQRDSWSGRLEMPTTENRYLYCMNDPIGYYDHGGDRADEGSGVPQKVTTSTNAKKTAATPKTPTPTPLPKVTPLPQPAPSPDTKFNANTAAKKSSNTFAKILIGAVTVAVCIGIIAVSGGFATPIAAMTFSTLFASSFATGITLRFGNNLIQQIDQTESFEEASDNAGKQTTKETPSILAFSLFTAGAGSLAGGVNSGALPSLGLKNIPFAASAFDDAIDDASGAYAGTQTTGATQSGSAGTTACTAGQGADNVAGGSLKFGSTSKSAEKLASQMFKRGWTRTSVVETVEGAFTTRSSTNLANNNPATAYFNSDGSYVVIDNVTKEIIQVSNRLDPLWLPDLNIINPYKP